MLRNSFNTSVTFRSELSSGSSLCSPKKAPAATLKWTQKAGAGDLLRHGITNMILYSLLLLPSKNPERIQNSDRSAQPQVCTQTQTGAQRSGSGLERRSSKMSAL